MHTQSRSLLLFTFVLLLALLVSCTPGSSSTRQSASSLPAASLTDSPAAPVAASPTPDKPRGPKKGQSTAAASTAGVAASAYVPAASEVNLILGRPTDHSITASLYAGSDMQVVINYGTTSGSYPSSTAPVSLKAAMPQDIELTDLAPDTAYYYQVISNGAASSEHTFHTQRLPGETFTFAIDADPHNREPNFNGQLFAIVLTDALAGHPDFLIDLGDTFMTEKLKAQSYADAEGTFIDMRSSFGIIGADAPLFLVNGNHEGEQGWLLTDNSRKDLPIWATLLRQLYYPNPVPNDFYSGSSVPDPALGAVRDSYYAWTWGDALFIALDPFWYTTSKPQQNDPDSNWGYTLGKEQYDWLRATLESSNAKFKFIFIHNLVGASDKDGRGGIEAAPYFEWGGKNADGTYGFDEHRPGWGVPIHQLLVENHVSAVFHGHDHVFVKQDLDGIVYQELPQPSIAKYDNTGLAAQYGYTHGDVISSSGYLRVTVTPDQVTVEYVRAYLPQDETAGQQNGEADYTYVIK